MTADPSYRVYDTTALTKIAEELARVHAKLVELLIAIERQEARRSPEPHTEYGSHAATPLHPNQ